MKNFTFNLRPVAVGILLLGSGVTSASTITLNGTDVMFTYDDTLTGLFGTPTVSGNTLFFTPAAFKAISTNGMGTVLTSSNMNVLVTPNAGVKLSSIGLQESGDYSLKGVGSTVDVGGELRAFDIGNPFTVQDTAFINTTSPLTSSDNKYHNWTATANLDLSSAAWQKANAVNFTIENVLEATTTARFSKAFIDKKFSGIQLSVGAIDGITPPSAVPVPGALWLFGSGLVGLVGISRRAAPSVAA